MKKDINRIYHIVIKFIEIMEEELELLSDHRSPSSVNFKRSIANNLAKLVSLMEKLQKLQKDSSENEGITYPEDDQSIIDEFLDKYLKIKNSK